MKSIFNRFNLKSSGLWIFFFILIFSTITHAGESIRITNGEWPPLFSEKLPQYGPCSRIVSEAFALEGVKVVYGFFPWERAFRFSEAGKWDGAIGWPYNKDKAKTHYYSKDVINKGECVFFFRKNMPFEWSSVNDLKKYKLGVTLGDWMLDGDDEFTKALRDGELKYARASRDELNFRKLARKRIDIFPQQLEVGYAQIKNMVKTGELKQSEADMITHYPTPYKNMPLYLLLNKKNENNKQMIELFDRGMRQLIDSGQYDRIYEEAR